MSKNKKDNQTKKEKKNNVIAFSDPYWHNSPSPYYKETHHEFRKKLRAFIDKEIIPYCDRWDEEGEYPTDLHAKAYAAGIYSPQFPAKYGGQPPKDFDYFHHFIWHDEIARCGTGGLVAGLFVSMQISLPPLIQNGSEELKQEICPKIIKGEKIMALAVTEPSGGSDVSNIKTTAIIDPNDSNYYIVNGEKYFITSGIKASYYTTAVRTKTTNNNNNNHDGISILIIDRHSDGVHVSRMKTQGWWCSNTAHITFKNVRVPVKNLIGKEHKGWEVVMHNFNHERFMLSVHSNRFSRICLTDAIGYAQDRKTFGKRLADHQVIRHKIAEMARRVESTHSLLEQIAFMVTKNVSEKDLAGICALAKVQATKNLEFCAREAVQIFGGRGYIRSGRAAKVERIYREVRVNAIGGGSEEILLDLAAKQAKL